jgi:Mg-chelatase subunit ChlI
MLLLLLLTDYARKEAESRYESVNRAIVVPDGNVGVPTEDVKDVPSLSMKHRRRRRFSRIEKGTE